nr:hypothetical protein [Aeromonas caviae]
MRTPDQIAEKSESSIKSQGMIPPCRHIADYSDELEARAFVADCHVPRAGYQAMQKIASLPAHQYFENKQGSQDNQPPDL